MSSTTPKPQSKQAKIDAIYKEVKSLAFTLFTQYRFPLNAKRRAERAIRNAQSIVEVFYTYGREESTDTANE